jgi:voltage-gated potassium channel
MFTVEYILRLTALAAQSVRNKFFGIIDLIAILPTYFSLFLPGSEYLLVIGVYGFSGFSGCSSLSSTLVKLIF